MNKEFSYDPCRDCPAEDCTACKEVYEEFYNEVESD